ncbi:MAG: hypothetical protein AAF636_21925 [Pseudomonadota bacterium]
MLESLGTAVLTLFIIWCAFGVIVLGFIGLRSLPEVIGDAAEWVYRFIRPKAAQASVDQVGIMASSLIVVAAAGTVLWGLGYVLHALFF